MFSGIVQGIGIVDDADVSRKGGYCVISCSPELLESIQTGASVSIDGVCLTVTNYSDRTMSFDISPETVEITTLKHIKKGDKVNIERSLRVGDEIGGHIVSGHVMGVGIIRSIEPIDVFLNVGIEVPDSLAAYIVEKGFIAIQGMSLTVNERKNNLISVMLIPETLKQTTSDTFTVGDQVNIEVDQQVKKLIDLST